MTEPSIPPDRPIRTLVEAMAWLAEQTNYERSTDWSYQRLGFHLDAYRDYLSRTGHPERRLPPTIHVAGTKGKGSTCLMLEAVFRAAGKRTGLYTSPHLVSVTERIRLDGQPIGDDRFAALLESMRPALEAFRDAVRPITFFEIVTTMAFRAFADAGVEVAILEVGLGGRLDATNVVDADVAVITQIGLDHTDKLGETRPEIAREKAGIIKPGRDVVVGPMPDAATLAAIRNVAAALDPAPVMFERDTARREAAELIVQLDGLPELRVPLPDRPAVTDGNLVCALRAMQRLGDHHPALRQDLPAAARTAAGMALPGRLEPFIRDGVRVVLDTAHNPDSFRALADWCRDRHLRPVLLLGMNRDKLTPDALAALPPAERLVVTTVPGARAATAAELRAAWPDRGTDIDDVNDPAAALARAMDAARDTGATVVITGSVYLAGALRPLLTDET